MVGWASVRRTQCQISLLPIKAAVCEMHGLEDLRQTAIDPRPNLYKSHLQDSTE